LTLFYFINFKLTACQHYNSPSVLLCREETNKQTNICHLNNHMTGEAAKLNIQMTNLKRK